MLMTGPRPGERVPLGDIDVYDPGRFQSGAQHGAFATLRAEAPVWRQETPDGHPFWSLTRYADVCAVLKDVTRFSSEHGTILAVTGGDSAGGRTINLMDRPEHPRVRVPTIRTMSTRFMRTRTEQVRANVLDVIAPALDGGEVDFAQLMFDLPMAAVGEILGIPREFWSDIPRWTMAGVAPDDPDFTDGETEQTLRQAHVSLFTMFQDLIAERREQPRDDLISMLIQLDMGGRRMDDQQVLLNCYSFVMGATTTTPHTASQLLLALVERPAVWLRARSERHRLDRVVEEGLRWSTPTNHLMRRTTTDVEIGGVTIPAGELVVAWVASANRDEAVFDDPYSFRPERSPNPHIAFGLGPHYCIGGPAARLGINLLVEELVERFDGFDLAGDVVHLRSNFINGITRLPLTARPAGGRRTGGAKAG